MWALKLVPFSSPMLLPECDQIIEAIVEPIMEGKSIDVMDLVNLVKTMFENSFKTVAKGGALFGDFLKEFSSFCPADVLNQENLDTVIHQIIDFIKMLFNLEEITKEIGHVIWDQISVTNEVLSSDEKCPFTVLLGVNVDIDLPIIGDITKGKGFYATYQKDDDDDIELIEVGTYESAEASTDSVSASAQAFAIDGLCFKVFCLNVTVSRHLHVH